MERVTEHDFLPHDLLRLAADKPAFADAPAWVAKSLERAPFVVVRRARLQNGLIPVGVRGSKRSERFGTWMNPKHIHALFKPENILVSLTNFLLPAFALLHAVRSACNATGLAWGPTGSVGFELVTGVSTVTPSSDLDIVLRAPHAFSRTEAHALLERLSRHASQHNTRIDTQIETPNGAFALAEFAHAGSRVMLRSADGPLFVDDPWRCVGQAA